MSYVNIEVNIKLQPNNYLHSSNQTKRKNRSKEQAHLILVLVAVLSNEGSSEPVHMCR